MNQATDTKPRLACYAGAPFQLRVLDPIAKAYPGSLVSLDADEIQAWKPDAIVVTAEHEVALFRPYCSANDVLLFALRHGAGNKYIAPCRAYALADYICGSEWDQRDFRRGGIVPLQEFLLTGNAWPDETFRLPPHTLDRERPTVLFAPTWNPQTSAARLLTGQLVPLVREVFPQARVVIRPHPNILTYDHPAMRPHAPLFQEWIQAWRKAAQEFPGVQFVDDPKLSISALFTDADILVSDGSSLIYEFTALERPILLYTSGEMPDFGEIDPLALANRYRDVGDEFRDEAEFVRSLRGIFARHEQTHRARQRALSDELFGKYRDGRCTQRVIEAIQAVLRGEHADTPGSASALPAAAEDLLRRANSELAAGRLEGACHRVVETLALAPHHLNTIVALANLLIRRGERLRAHTELMLALELDPRCVAALSSLAALRVQQNQLDEARTVLQRLLAVQPDNADARKALAAIERAQLPPPAPAPVSAPQPRMGLQQGGNLERIPCPFCGNTDAESYRAAADIVKCRGCQTVYLRTRPSAAELDRIYQTYTDEGSHLKLPADAAQAAASGFKRDYFLREILEFNPTRGPLLDVGCSWGPFLLTAREQGFTPMGVEITRKAVRFANETLGIPVVNSQFLDTPIPSAALQAVTMLHVLEHLPQPKQAIAKAFDILKPDGLFCGIVPNIGSFCSQRQRDEWYWLDPNYHYVHYTPATLRAHLVQAGFVVERLYTTRGDFDVQRIRALVPELDEAAFQKFSRELEDQGQGEEIRFFARKPAAIPVTVTESFTLPRQRFDWPVALDPYVQKQDGKTLCLSETILDPARLPAVLAEIGPFHFHCGGAGDALLLMAGFYDKEPCSTIVSYANSAPALKSLFEAFPALKAVYFLPAHTSPQVHARLRAVIPELPNCRGAGATPKKDYFEEWTEQLDIFRDYGVVQYPAWAQQFKKAPAARTVTIAPRGSLVGMAGSKRNIIDPRRWTEIVQFIQARGYRPIILGTPDERNEYPCLDGCDDQRSYSFRAQMEQIAGSSLFVGADSWAKTFAALAGIRTLVFEPIKGNDWRGQKDPSDFVFLDPWECIQVVSGLEMFREVFLRFQEPETLPRVCQVAAEFPNQKRHTVHVAWEGAFLDLGSLAQVNRELTRELSRQPRVELACVGKNIVSNDCASSPSLQNVARQLKAQAPKQTQVTVRHGWPPDWRRPASGALVVIQPWEFGALPADWVPQLKKVDEVWVPSEYVRRVYIDSGASPAKVKVVPNGVDPAKFRPDAAPIKLKTGRFFKFIFVGGTIHRKGPDVLLKTYAETFTAADDVCLVIKDFGGRGVYAGQTLEARIKAIQARPDAPEILHLTDDLPPEELPGLYTACDCLVHPYRGEGFGLPVLEAMACGLPVVVTGGGATDDFASDEYVYRIPGTRQSIGYRIGDIKLARRGWLLEPSAPVLAEWMSWIFKHREEARSRGRLASEYARREWTWERAAKIAAQRLQNLLARRRVEEEALAARRARKPYAIEPAGAGLRELPALPDTPRLSVCLIVKNEEAFLARCLKSVKPVADQIVVVDTGSTDRTMEIARAHGAEVHSVAWTDDFSAARNVSLAHATGDWVLVLDADEELPLASHPTLLKEMRDGQVIAYRLPIVDVGREDEGCHYVPRLFRNVPGVAFVGRIHEQAFTSLEPLRRRLGLENRLGATALLHYGYTEAVTRQRNKNARNLQLLERAVEEQPNDANLLMNFGMELVRGGQWEEGMEQYREAVRIVTAQPADEVAPELRETLLSQLASHLMGARRFEEVVRLLRAPLAQACGPTAAMHFTLGLALMELNQLDEAGEQFRQTLAKRDQPALSPIITAIRNGAVHHGYAICLARSQKLQAAEEMFRAGLAESPLSRALRLDYALFQAQQGHAIGALKSLRALVNEQPEDAAVWRAGGRIALGRPDFLKFACEWTAEAVKQLPQDAVIVQQRAEALLLSGQARNAVGLWCRLPATPHVVAALLICEVPIDEVPAGQEKAVSREFVGWVQRLIEFQATSQVMRINERLESLERILPTAAKALAEAVAVASAG